MGWASDYIEQLRNGETVKFRPRGKSMRGRIEDGQLVTMEPVVSPEQVEPGDAVLCTVEGRQSLHLLTAVRDDQFQISDNHGRSNGWCTIRQIHGRLIQIEP